MILNEEEKRNMTFCIRYYNKFILIALGLILLIIVVYIFARKRRLQPNVSNRVLETPKSYCDRTRVICTRDTDCSDKCVSYPSVQWLCHLNHCTPSERIDNCNINNGGIWVFNYSSHSFFCHCHYPNYFHGAGCETQNPVNCTNGTLKEFDATKNLPDLNFCKCNRGYGKVVINIGQNREIATCISNKIKFFFS